MDRGQRPSESGGGRLRRGLGSGGGRLRRGTAQARAEESGPGRAVPVLSSRCFSRSALPASRAAPRDFARTVLHAARMIDMTAPMSRAAPTESNPRPPGTAHHARGSPKPTTTAISSRLLVEIIATVNSGPAGPAAGGAGPSRTASTPAATRTAGARSAGARSAGARSRGERSARPASEARRLGQARPARILRRVPKVPSAAKRPNIAMSDPYEPSTLGSNRCARTNPDADGQPSSAPSGVL